jgi:hypothetical protein
MNKKARVDRAQYHNRQLLNRQTLTRSKFSFVLFPWADYYATRRTQPTRFLLADAGRDRLLLI